MHLLYVVELQTEGQDIDAYDRLLGHVANWLQRDLRDFDTADLLSDGRREIDAVGNRSAKEVTWTSLRPGESRALLLEVTQHADEVALTTRVTVSDHAGRTTLRVGIARQSYGSAALSPVGYTTVFQPRILQTIASDGDLTARVGGQAVDGRYLQLTRPEHVAELPAILESRSRLPVLLVHTRTQPAWDFAREAARKFIGLVRVVTLSSASRARLREMRTDVDVPFGGARLIWSDFRASGPSWSAEKIEQLPLADLRDSVMRIVAPVSALYRGTDHVWREIKRAAQSAELEALSEVASRTPEGSLSAELRRSLETRIRLLTESSADFEALAAEYSREADLFRTRAEQADQAEADAKYWRELYLQQFAQAPEAVDPWERIPPLIAGSDPSDTFLALDDASEGRITFTDNARRSWSKIDYPEPEDMLAKLVSLARAATALYSRNAGPMGHLNEWFKVNHEINVSMNDDTIEKNRRLRYFEHQGQTLDQVPHVKVRDGVKPNQVGRIHFALDPDNGRLVVNHVALKLYGN